MFTSTIPLSGIHIVDKDAGLNMVVQGSMGLLLPRGCDHLRTSDDLLQAVKGQHLWIARTGICQLFATIMSRNGNLATDRYAPLVDWIISWELWERLGLRLQETIPSFEDSTGQAVFSLQHPDLSSALTAPSGALIAEFQSVSYSFDVFYDEDTTHASNQSNKQRRKTRRRSDKEDNRNDPLPGSPNGELYQLLTNDDQKAIDDFMSRFTPPLPGGRTDVCRKRAYAEAWRPAERIPLYEHVQRLLHTTLRMLVLGGCQTYKGIKVIEGRVSPSLAQMAPGVFHMDYLKVITERAKFMPVIATSLARMRNAESPRLRQKVIAFASGTVPSISDASFSDEVDFERIVCSIEQATWKTILANTKQPASRRRVSANDELETNPIYGESNEFRSGLVASSQIPSYVEASQRIVTQECDALYPYPTHGLPPVAEPYTNLLPSTYAEPQETPVPAYEEPLLRLFSDENNGATYQPTNGQFEPIWAHGSTPGHLNLSSHDTNVLPSPIREPQSSNEIVYAQGAV